MDIFDNIGKIFGVNSEPVIAVLLISAFLLSYVYSNADELRPKSIKRLIIVMVAAILAVGAVGYHQYMLRLQALDKVAELQKKLAAQNTPVVVTRDTSSSKSKTPLDKYLDESSDDRENDDDDMDDDDDIDRILLDNDTSSSPTFDDDFTTSDPDLSLDAPPSFSYDDAPGSTGDTYVRPYVRKDGTFVEGHFRTRPDATPYNNYSYDGNVNPYTGKVGHHRASY